MWERRDAYRVLVGRREGKRPLEDQGVDGRIILKLILRKLGGVVWTGLIWMRVRTVGWLL
jgi:hypothetical protein